MDGAKLPLSVVNEAMLVVLKKATENYGRGGLDVAPFVCSTGAPLTTSSHWRDAFFFFLSPPSYNF